ncbi:uncharacterized protein LOC141600631 [Silene latifolia]|uniref:uncharacterized protein LOC141600631 n=1 Tax=Silene latifolia TaxID=37657 RepID=UPI003D76FC71
MAPYEALYGQKCRTPLCWNDIDETRIIGPDLIQETTDKIRIIREKMRTAQSRQKSYADLKRRPLEFQEGDSVFLKVSPTKGVVRFGKQRKLSPRYIGPFEIIERVGDVAYRLLLPIELSKIHDVFHISVLKKYISDPSHVITIPPLQVREDLSYEELPIQILDYKEKVLRNKTISLVKVLWSRHEETEATWEVEQEMKDKYPHLFQ